MRAFFWAVVVLGAVAGGAAWWLGPAWTLGRALDAVATPLAAVATPLAAMPGAATALAAISPATPARPLAAATPTATPDPSLRAITVTEDAVNEFLTTAAFGQELGDSPFGPVTLESLHVRFRPGEVVVLGVARGAPGRLDFTISGTLAVDGGALRPVVREMRVNDLPLPPAMRATIEQAFSTAIATTINAERLRVAAVEVGDRTVVVRVAR